MSNESSSKKSIRILTSSAMLCAISVILGILCKNFLNFGAGLFRITFENLPIILAGILYGPVAGAIVGACSDIISYCLSMQMFAISPFVTLCAAAVGLVAGLVSHLLIRKRSYAQILLSEGLAHLIGSVILKSQALYPYYGKAVLWRIPTYFGIFCVESFLLCLLFRNPSLTAVFGEKPISRKTKAAPEAASEEPNV